MTNNSIVQNQPIFYEVEQKICRKTNDGWHNVSEEVKNVGVKMEVERLKHKRQPVKKTSTLP